MSRTYRVQAADVEASVDGKRKINILPLPGVQADAIEECLADGWQPVEGKPAVLTKTIGGATATVDLAAGELQIQASARLSVEGKGYSATDNQAEGEAAAHKDAMAQRGRRQQEAEANASAIVTAAEEPAAKAVMAALSRAYVTAIKRRAHQLGDVESEVHGTGAQGLPEVTIKVRV